MYKEYDNATLKKLQDCELNILKDFIGICNKHKIGYFAIGGTAIGAVRHHGFIPWDDDIDVGMLRKDYVRFIKAVEKEMSDKYEIISAAKNEEYPFMFSQFKLKNTEFIYYPFRHLKYQPGICMDIFILDTVSSVPAEQKKQIRKAWFWFKLMILQKMPYPVLPAAFNGWKKKMVYFICACIHWAMKIFHVKKSMLYKKCMKVALEHNEEETGWVCDLCDTNPYMTLFRKDDLFPTRDVEFEDIHIKVPHHNDQMLKKYYGDYMKLPPVEKRKNHPPTILKFADGERIVFGEDGK